MTMKTFAMIAITLATTAAAFQPLNRIHRLPNPVLVYSTSKENEGKSSFDMDKLTANFDLDKLKASLPNLKSLNKNSDELLENVYGGEFGTRGEAYVAAQVVLMALVALGGIPVIGGALNFVLGPGLILVGAAVVLNGVTEMGSTLSPWPVPAEKGELITTGIFSKIRHPLYAGALAICAGLSVATDSPTRLLLTAALWYVLELKSDYEEKQLKQAYSEYGEYMNEVPGKFFPQEILDVMPWNKKKDVN